MRRTGGKLTAVGIFFEIPLGVASVLVTWFAVYVLFRLVNDES